MCLNSLSACLAAAQPVSGLSEEALVNAGVLWDSDKQAFLFNVKQLTTRRNWRLKNESVEEEYTAVCLLTADRAGACVPLPALCFCSIPRLFISCVFHRVSTQLLQRSSRCTSRCFLFIIAFVIVFYLQSCDCSTHLTRRLGNLLSMMVWIYQYAVSTQSPQRPLLLGLAVVNPVMRRIPRTHFTSNCTLSPHKWGTSLQSLSS